MESIIGAELFNTEVQILLTDRGSEFTAADAMEIRGDETRRTSVYLNIIINSVHLDDVQIRMLRNQCFIIAIESAF